MGHHGCCWMGGGCLLAVMILRKCFVSHGFASDCFVSHPKFLFRFEAKQTKLGGQFRYFASISFTSFCFSFASKPNSGTPYYGACGWRLVRYFACVHSLAAQFYTFVIIPEQIGVRGIDVKIISVLRSRSYWFPAPTLTQISAPAPAPAIAIYWHLQLF